ncbi:unnamed protein product [Allacma fusca]|uniref:UDENN domain-containing protein n=1 Tax=Allacma fusca TaxID=39272 RepID=A0A8J2J6Z3_9HEXA|nr:unnamed protein product [Allacma fusca]
MDSILPWDRFRDWIHCIAVVTFDLELGQTLETIYPSHVKLSEEEKSNVCYLSFPDSNSGCMGDTQFHFRIRNASTTADLTGARLSKTLVAYNQKCPNALQVYGNYMLGYVHFRQVKDPSLRRGYFQKSVLILSRFPFINLFNQILCILAPEFFDNGISVIESACRDIYHWPAPIPGQTLNLPLLGTVFQVLIPTVACLRANGSPTKSRIQINSSPTKTMPVMSINSVHDPDLFQCLRPVLSHIHLLWELVLTGEPIVVMAPLPDTCANTVHALISTIFPLRYCADFRPYFTIHDTDFKEYTMKSTPPPPVILGVTNPFFAKTLQHWPHIIRMGENSGIYSGKLKKASNIKLLDSQPGVYTCYKPFLQKDNSLLKKIVLGMQSQRPGEVQTAILRIHLQELTESFMIPLERYLASLMPLQKNISPLKAAPLPRPFKQDDFLATLDASGPQLTSGIRGEWAGLYKKFFRSINFSEWYNMRYKEAKRTLQGLHLETIAEADVNIHKWITGKDEVEVVDWILKLRDQITQTHLPIKECVRQKLQQHIEKILKTLPDDLQTVLQPK